LEFASNVGEVLGVDSTLGVVTIVSLGAEGGSMGSLALVVVTAEILVGAASFILALDLVGGIYLMAFGIQGPERLNDRGSVLFRSNVNGVESWLVPFGGADCCSSNGN
jgi:hypothetical protein